MIFFSFGQLLPVYVSSEQFLSDIWSATLNWVSSGLNSFQTVGQKVVAPIVMLKNVLGIIGYSLTATEIICLGIVCYQIMYEEGFCFQIMFEAGPQGWGRDRNQVLSIALAALDDTV